LTPEGREALDVITVAASSCQSEVARGLDRPALQRTRNVLCQILDRIADAEGPRSVDG
jgi:hypothetical protein